MDALVERQAGCLTVLDISDAALARARARLGARAGAVRWIRADVTGDWDVPAVDVWHDRAVFHFLTEPGDRQRYIGHLHRAVRPQGHVILGTFALSGPPMCSGLPVVRYSAEALGRLLGPDFRLARTFDEAHVTPRGATQMFCWTLFQRRAAPGG